jgi:hypothetical protein
MRKSKDIVVVPPEELKRMTSDEIARFMRKNRNYWIINPGDPGNDTDASYIVERTLQFNS